jgi:hypothetical protein
VRYRLEGDPITLAVCHCSECQRQSGSAFGMSLVVKSEAFELLAGAPRKFTRSSDSGRRLHCFFCPDCGNRIYHEREGSRGTVNVKAGTLDDRSWLVPAVHVWTAEKQPWVRIDEGTPCFEGQP